MESFRTKIVRDSLEFLKSRKLNELQTETLKPILKIPADKLTTDQFNSLHHLVEEIKLKQGYKK